MGGRTRGETQFAVGGRVRLMRTDSTFGLDIRGHVARGQAGAAFVDRS